MEHRAPLWTLLGIVIVFKLATTATILIMDPNGITKTLSLFFAYDWPLILAGVIAGTVMVSVTILSWIRLLRVRARRRELQAAEWRAD